MRDPLPTFAELPEMDVLGRKLRSAWGVFGDDDELGTWNLATAEKVREATALVRKGSVFRLDLPLNEPNPALFEYRGVYDQVIEEITGGLKMAYDDHLDHFYTQSSSQWDGHRHVCLPTNFASSCCSIPNMALTTPCHSTRGQEQAGRTRAASGEQTSSSKSRWAKSRSTTTISRAGKRAASFTGGPPAPPALS